MSERLDVGALLRRLHDAEVDYILIGGLAVNAWGVIRSTKDIDICPSPDAANLERLARLLQQLGARQLGVREWVPGIEADQAYPILAVDAEPAVVFGIEIKVCSLADLRAMKRAAGRPQDLADLADLDRAHPPGS